MRDEFKVKIGIFSKTVTPEEVSSVLGMSCDDSFHMGDLMGKTIRRYKENGWVVYSRVSRYAWLQTHIKDVLKRTSSVKGKIGGLESKKGVEVELGCVIRTSSRPAIYFTTEQIKALSDMGASIDIDLYTFLSASDEKIIKMGSKKVKKG